MSVTAVKFHAYNRHGHIEAVSNEIDFYDYEIRDNPIDRGDRIILKRLGTGKPKKILFEDRFGGVPITFKIKDSTLTKIKQLKALADSEGRVIVYPAYTKKPTLSRVVILPDDQIIEQLFIAGYEKGNEDVTVEFMEVEHELPVNMLMIRNKDLDNTLSTTDGTPIYVTQIDAANNMIRLNWLPNIKSLFEPDSGYEWALVNLELNDGLPADPDPSRAGNYTHSMKIIKHSTYSNQYMYETKWLKYSEASGLEAAWNVNDRVMLFNPFVGKFDKAGLKDYIVTYDAGTAWRSDYVTAGPAYKHSDGDWVVIVNGRNSGTSVYTVGAAKGPTLTAAALAFMNSDAPVITYLGSAGWYNKQIICSSILPIPDVKHPQYIGFCSGYTGAKWKIGWVKFDEDFQSVTYLTAGSETVDSSGSSNGLINPSVVLYKGQYWMAYIDRSDNANPELATGGWKVKIAKCSTIDGTYVYDHQICAGRLTNDGSWRSCHCDAVGLYIHKGELYALVGGTPWYLDSGLRGTREYGLFKYDELTAAWVEDRRSPILMNPIDGVDIWGASYTAATDHMGGYPFFYHDEYNNTLYLFFSMNNSSDNYSIFVVYFDLDEL